MDNKLQDIELLFIAANDAFSQGDVASAASRFSEITEKYPADSRGWSGMAEIYFTKIGDIQKSEAFFKKAIETTNTSAKTYLLFSDLLLQLNRFAEMNAIVNQAMEIEGVSKSAGHIKSGLLKESQGKYDEAIEDYRASILASFDADEINMSEKAILRCQIKKKYS